VNCRGEVIQQSLQESTFRKSAWEAAHKNQDAGSPESGVIQASTDNESWNETKSNWNKCRLLWGEDLVSCDFRTVSLICIWVLVGRAAAGKGLSILRSSWFDGEDVDSAGVGRSMSWYSSEDIWDVCCSGLGDWTWGAWGGVGESQFFVGTGSGRRKFG
jgi:hypothetical protein